jgi:3-hydroxymyristoyl/3-hydroxydecanoyl-(acyl carrier protein) dehydratase
MSDTIDATFRIAPDHPALAGHFPGNPVVPGVVVLDRVAALIESQGARLAGFTQAKFVAPLLPGEEARVELAADGARRRFRVLRGDALVASGEAETA